MRQVTTLANFTGEEIETWRGYLTCPGFPGGKWQAGFGPWWVGGRVQQHSALLLCSQGATLYSLEQPGWNKKSVWWLTQRDSSKLQYWPSQQGRDGAGGKGAESLGRHLRSTHADTQARQHSCGSHWKTKYPPEQSRVCWELGKQAGALHCRDTFIFRRILAARKAPHYFLLIQNGITGESSSDLRELGPSWEDGRDHKVLRIHLETQDNDIIPSLCLSQWLF